MARPGLRGRNPGPQRLQASGFTLLDIMVVVVIIGIIATIATLSVGVTSRDQGVDREIRRIQDLLALVSEQAVLQGREYGLTFYAHEYGFSAYDYGIGRWEPLLDDPVLAPRKLPPDAVVDLYIDGRQVRVAPQRPQPGPEAQPDQPRSATRGSTKRTGTANTGKDEEMPQVFIMSSGDVTPFEVRLRPETGKPGISLKVADSGEAQRVADEQ